jgi:hypothetical protein
MQDETGSISKDRVGQIRYGELTQTVWQPGALQDVTKPDSFSASKTTSPQMHPSRKTRCFIRTRRTQESSAGSSRSDVALPVAAVSVGSMSGVKDGPRWGRLSTSVAGLGHSGGDVARNSAPGSLPSTSDSEGDG